MAYQKISQTDYDKAKGQLRLQLNGVFQAFNLYGLHIFINGAIDEIMELAEQFGRRVRGDDIPIKLKKRRRSNDSETQ